jgi:hypothetical protein
MLMAMHKQITLIAEYVGIRPSKAELRALAKNDTAPTVGPAARPLEGSRG